MSGDITFHQWGKRPGSGRRVKAAKDEISQVTLPESPEGKPARQYACHAYCADLPNYDNLKLACYIISERDR